MFRAVSSIVRKPISAFTRTVNSYTHRTLSETDIRVSLACVGGIVGFGSGIYKSTHNDNVVGFSTLGAVGGAFIGCVPEVLLLWPFYKVIAMKMKRLDDKENKRRQSVTINK